MEVDLVGATHQRVEQRIGFTGNPMRSGDVPDREQRGQLSDVVAESGLARCRSARPGRQRNRRLPSTFGVVNNEMRHLAEVGWARSFRVHGEPEFEFRRVKKL
ncbi:hypothetical protein [Nocardia sp. NPDC057272]|uniref:hypothetical protein n=1 Tax=Nocardia sp. NPDC057272 TaxID=3346079 RepID=UPI003633D3C6